MSEKCKTKEGLCQCVDWHDGTPAGWIDHLMRDYEFDHLLLDYHDLSKDTEIRLCQIGAVQQVRRANLYRYRTTPLRTAG